MQSYHILYLVCQTMCAYMLYVSTFFVAQVVRQHESSSIGSDVRIANIRGAMRLARGVIVGVAAKDITPTQQLHLLEV